MKFGELNEMAFKNKSAFEAILKNIKDFGISEIDKTNLETSESKIFKSRFINKISELNKMVKEN